MYLVGSLGSACMARAARRFSGCRNIAFFVDPARSDACVVYSVQFCEKCAIARNRSFWYSFKRVETSLHYVFIKFYFGKINIYIDMNSPLHEVICIILCEISTIPYFWKSSYEEAVGDVQNPYRFWSHFRPKSYHFMRYFVAVYAKFRPSPIFGNPHTRKPFEKLKILTGFEAVFTENPTTPTLKHPPYDGFWLKTASKPVRILERVKRLARMSVSENRASIFYQGASH